MKKLLSCLLILLFVHCRERYDIPFNSPTAGYLVVEGVITYGGPTTIQLSRSSPLGAVSIVPELHALVQVEGEDHSVFLLSESDSGYYRSDELPLNPAIGYRIRIAASNNKVYTSTFRSVILTPEIDSLSWERDEKGVAIFVNAHDSKNTTRYYKWDYEETWEFKSAYKTNARYYNTGEVIQARGS